MYRGIATFHLSDTALISPQTPVRYLKTLLLPVNLLVVALIVGRVSVRVRVHVSARFTHAVRVTSFNAH